MGTSYSQSKSKSKEQPPTQKEMEAMMKEMQTAINEISPEDKKALDSMGFKMPDMKSIQKNVSGISDAQLKKAYEDDNRIVPEKDNARIASIPKAALTMATMPGFLQSVQNFVISRLSPSVATSGENAYQWLKTKYQTSTAIGNAAVGCWMLGKPELALYIMSKAAKDDPIDADNLNNLSAMLTMAGAEQLAIPILDHLNKLFPQNSTVLCNIGQAWFGLGDLNKSEKYLDSTIRIYACHPQANYSKSLIEESKGNKQGAVEAAKRSIKEAYSMEKENRLNKLGYKLKEEDLTWNIPMPQDPLGLEKFRRPDYPKNVAESKILEAEWDAFVDRCESRLAELDEEQKKKEAEMTEISQQRTKELLKAGQNGMRISPLPPFAPKAAVKLKYLVDGKDGQLVYSYQHKLEAVAAAYKEAERLDEILENQLQVLEKKYEDKFGEGKANPFDAACADDTKAKNAFLSSANQQEQSTYNDFLNLMRRKLNDELYYYQYTTWPENFELAKVNAKITWINLIKSAKPKFKDKSGWCQQNPDMPETDTTLKLAQFDDMHCNYHSEANLLVGQIKSDCGRLTAKLDLDFIKLGLKTKQGDRDDESFLDQFQSCSIEIGVKKGVSLAEAGPLKAEAKVGVAAFVEIDKTGISDAGLKVSSSIKAGTNVVKDKSIKVEPIKGMSTLGPSAGDESLTIIGTEAKISLISGFSVEGKGILKGLKK